MKINKHYLALQESYLFSTIAKKVSDYQQKHPEADIIRMGIGDVTLPLCPAVVKAMGKAVQEMGNQETFRGYGPEQGYDFLREKIAAYYASYGVSLELEEVFVSDGAKSDVGNILDIIAQDNVVLIPNPVYPVYLDTNIMAGRKVQYLQANEENAFLPMPDVQVKADVIYLCSPNNPTGAVYNREQLRAWVTYAQQQDAIILFDAAYESFIQEAELPRSIYEIDGAKTCAIEFCSLSKTAGFTGTRCGYTIVPKALKRDGAALNQLWLRRQTTKFNGVAYIVQRGAEAVFSPEGQRQTKEAIAYYQQNAAIMAQTLREMEIWFTGGTNSPYLWMKCPDGLSSWEYFDKLLEKAHVVGTPGVGFGENGEGFFRLTAFGNKERTKEAMDRIRTLHQK